MRENGLKIGSIIKGENYTDQNQKSINIIKYDTKVLMLFISMYCVRCIDLLPYLKDVSNIEGTSVVLYSTGSFDDHKSMEEYFGWDFPVIAINSEEMNKDFGVHLHPFCMLVDVHHAVINKGPVFNYDDVLRMTV